MRMFPEVCDNFTNKWAEFNQTILRILKNSLKKEEHAAVLKKLEDISVSESQIDFYILHILPVYIPPSKHVSKHKP